MAATISEYTTVRCDTNGLAWSPDGSLLATAHQDGFTRLWETENYTLLNTLNQAYGWQRGVAWSPDGTLLAVVGADYTLRVYTVSSGELLASESYGSLPLWTVAWSPDGTRLAFGAGDYNDQGGANSIYIIAAP
jgi:WD40 repeat protein